MGILNVLFGKKPEKNSPKSKLCLQLLFDRPLNVDSATQTANLRAYHQTLHQAKFEIDPETSLQGTPAGEASWGSHKVTFIGFNAPFPAEALEHCVAPAHYDQDIKARARSHVAHALFFYEGRATDPLEAYIALACVAGSLFSEGAIVVANEHAHTSIPAAIIAMQDDQSDVLEMLRAMPLLFLFCGFVKHEVEGVSGVWTRTYGNDVFGLPNFATHIAGHGEGSKAYGIFNDVMSYLRKAGNVLKAGHTMQIGDDNFMKLRNPGAAEAMLQDDKPLLIAEFINAEQANRQVHPASRQG